MLSTKRDGAADVPARDEKVGQPKGLSEYGWGETGYALSSASQPLMGKRWVSVPSCPPPPSSSIISTAMHKGELHCFGSDPQSGSLCSQEGDFCVLGIETSCDDTAAAVVHSNGTILGESKRTQDELHANWGGVVPGLARDAHQAAIEQVVEEALCNAAMAAKDVDAVAVTMGPGLEICLRVGFRKARDIALAFDRPFVSVHHLEAHVLTVRQSDPSIQFPFLVLLVSGGHCQLLVAVAVGEYKMLGGTLDDSLGEAYDKTARMLGLDVGGGGGQVLEALARSGDPLAVKFGVPMKTRKVCWAAGLGRGGDSLSRCSLTPPPTRAW